MVESAWDVQEYTGGDVIEQGFGGIHGYPQIEPDNPTTQRYITISVVLTTKQYFVLGC